MSTNAKPNFKLRKMLFASVIALICVTLVYFVYEQNKAWAVPEEVKKLKGSHGYNVSTDKYEDLVKAGVVDPKKVTRTALQNAASIAGLLLTTECLVTEIPEKDKKAPMPGHGGGMGEMDY